MTQRKSEMIFRADSSEWIFHLDRLYSDITPTEKAPFGIAVNKLEPGGVTTRHSHGAVELFLITKGRVEAKIDQTLHVLTTGDSCFVPSNIEHNLSNPSDENTVEFICIWWRQDVPAGS